MTDWNTEALVAADKKFLWHPFADNEVMTGFGRTGRMFAIEHEEVVPDILVLAKGPTGGYLPLAITLTTEEIFGRFDGSIADGKALAYGHSYTANALACAAAQASLEVFEQDGVLGALQPKIEQMRAELTKLGDFPLVEEVRQCGFIGAIELREGPANGAGRNMARDVCLAARHHGLLTRPIRHVIVLMPPLCLTSDQLTKAIEAIRSSIAEVSESVSG
jgi:adenosylmethionine---8-amino-7-oxononanoate aminotransferase